MTNLKKVVLVAREVRGPGSDIPRSVRKARILDKIDVEVHERLLDFELLNLKLLNKYEIISLWEQRFPDMLEHLDDEWFWNPDFE